MAPRYEDATWGGESVVLDNGALRVAVHRRTTGWGWVEFSNPAGDLLGVMEHLGEVKFPGDMIPARLEAETVEQEEGAFGTRLSFAVRQTPLDAMTRRSTVFGPAYARADGQPQQPSLAGTVTLTLPPGRAALAFTFHCAALTPVNVCAIRGPWLKAGAGSHGAAKDDAIFAGVEWCVGSEWSSGTDWFPHPWALRVAPHPLKVSAPFMAVSHGGWAIGLVWDPRLKNPFHLQHHYPQPVFASPNFIDRKDNHLMGLVFPAATDRASDDRLVEKTENRLEEEGGLCLLPGMGARFEGEVIAGPGDSLDLMADWVQRTGLPEPPEPRWSPEEALDRIAGAYNTHLWHAGRGWGMSAEEASPRLPYFVPAYIEHGRDRETAAGLAAKRDWATGQAGPSRQESDGMSALGGLDSDQLRVRGRELLERQRPDGSFPFDPEGVHGGANQAASYTYAADTWKPLGRVGDTALDLCVSPAMELLGIYEATGDETFADGARRALDYCLPMRRPEGGDWWETPLHSPNLLAAGHAAVAYAVAARCFHVEAYSAAAVHWIRALLPFTQLWQPDESPMLYYTKPCLCSTNWWLANWVSWHVQWEVLQTFAISRMRGVDWAALDPEIDWNRYREGITFAALRWMVAHEDPGTTTLDPDRVASGRLDTLYHDVHEATSGKYSGALILPEPIAVNLQAILERRGP